MNGQIIPSKYLDELKEFFVSNRLMQPQVIWENEEKFRNFFNVETFKFVNSGTSALYLIMNYLKSLEGDAVVWGPAFTHISWINCANWLDMRYDFVDVSEKTLSLDPNKLLEKIEAEGPPDIVVMVDMCGYVGDDTLLVRDICDNYGITMIEDSAHAIGQKYIGRYSGTFGHFGFYSFSTPKLLTVGEGGGLICADEDLNKKFDDAIYQGGWYKNMKESYTKGLNFIMSNWLTELLSYQLRDLREIQQTHHLDFHHYLAQTPDLFTFPSELEYPAPSIFVRKCQASASECRLGQIPEMLWGRYRNMAEDKEAYPVAQELEESLVYWRL